MVLWGDYTTMPRGGQEILGDPFRTWVVTVDEKNRVRLPLEIGTVVPWIDLKPGQIECVGMPGPWGGIQVNASYRSSTGRATFRRGSSGYAANVVGVTPEVGRGSTPSSHGLATSGQRRG
jgi:hypothetical protein